MFLPPATAIRPLWSVSKAKAYLELSVSLGKIWLILHEYLTDAFGKCNETQTREGLQELFAFLALFWQGEADDLERPSTVPPHVSCPKSRAFKQGL